MCVIQEQGAMVRPCILVVAVVEGLPYAKMIYAHFAVIM
jgi:hypothetical protein